MKKRYRWEQNYEMSQFKKHWAINDTESDEKGVISSPAMILMSSRALHFGLPLDQEPLPRRIIAALNACEGIPTDQLETMDLSEFHKEKT